MNEDLLLTIVATGVAVAFFHAAIPTHWLPFVVTGRAQGWSRARTLGVTALAGAGHVFFTCVLGAFVVGLGVTIDRWQGTFFPYLAGGILMLLGFYYLLQQWRGRGHGHSHFGHSHDHPHGRPHSHPHLHSDLAPLLARETLEVEHLTLPSADSVPLPARTSDRAAILGLLGALTFSPCEGFLPVFLSGAPFGVGGFLLLAAVLGVATLAGMLAFTWLTLVGLERFKLAALERVEQGLLGALLCVLGLVVMIFER